MSHLVTIQIFGGPEATLPTLADREPGFTTDTHKLYVGWLGTNYLIGGGGGGGSSPLTTKGDIWGFSTIDARVPVGANGQLLSADSGQATGLKWVDPPDGSSFILMDFGSWDDAGVANGLVDLGTW